MSVSDGKDEVLSLDDDGGGGGGGGAGGGGGSALFLRHLTLLSKDHQSFSLSKEAAASSELLKTMMEGDPDACEVQLFHIDSLIVRKVIDYMNYHRTTPARAIDKPISSTHMADLVDAWDAHYVDVEQELLFKLLLAANYLNVRSLIALCCAKFASLIKNKTPEQIRVPPTQHRTPPHHTALHCTAAHPRSAEHSSADAAAVRWLLRAGNVWDSRRRHGSGGGGDCKGIQRPHWLTRAGPYPRPEPAPNGLLRSQWM